MYMLAVASNSTYRVSSKNTRISKLHLLGLILYSQHTVAAAVPAAVPKSPPQNPYAAPPASVAASPAAAAPAAVPVANLVAPGIIAQSKPTVVSPASVPYPQHFEVNLTVPVLKKSFFYKSQDAMVLITCLS